MGYLIPDTYISKISGNICPFGGFGCKLGIHFILRLIEKWNGIDAITSSYYVAISCILELINAKDGFGSDIRKKIKQIRKCDDSF